MASSSSLQVFLSNRLEVLYQQLKHNLFINSFPFAKRLVVVYGPAMKAWLTLKMAQDPTLDVAMGVEFIDTHQAFDELLRLTSSSPLYFPTSLELNLMIEKELMRILQQFKQLDAAEQRDWSPFLHYLKLNPQQEGPYRLSRRMERRLIGISHHLTQLFQDYGRYAGRLMAQWDVSPNAGWQSRLWRYLFNGKTGWNYSSRALQSAQPMPIHSSTIHFFSISFLTAGEFSFLDRLAAQLPIYYYTISPCAVFWSDVRSDKETAYLQNFWKQKLGPFSPRLIQLEELLRDRNPLLANFGRMGREMAYQVEESAAQTVAYYSMPSSFREVTQEPPFYDDLYLTESSVPLSILQAIQADLLLMRNPQDQPSFNFKEEKRSIQLHIAPNKRREIEILYHNLLGLMHHDATLRPRDILVMSPQIADYVPYIQSIFGSEKSELNYQILDLGLQTQNEIVQGFLQLMTLSEGKWDSSQLLQLFEHRSFQRRHHLTAADYHLIQEWIEQAGIRWGETTHHRNDLLQRRHCQQGMVDETVIGTWDYGLTRLLTGLTTVLNQQNAPLLETPPCSAIEFSQGELLGQWIRLLESLRDDLAPLHDRTQLTIHDWVNYLHCLIDHYFQPDFEQPSSIEEKEELKNQLELLRVSARFCEETLFPFQSIKTHLLHLFSQRGMTYQENQIETVRFCSFVPLRSIPARVISLIGMQEGAFPRSPHTSSLNLMIGKEEVDYCPTSTDYDRYLFLEALHATQDYLLMSFPGYHSKDGKELQPSLLIEELFHYLDKFYTIQQQKISHYCTFKHPFDSFDAQYFYKNSLLFNFSQESFKVAKIYYQTDKNLAHCFLNRFVKKELELKELLPHQTQVDLKQLVAVAKNPIKFHLNKVLEIYLQQEEDRQCKTEEELTVSPLNKYQLKQSALKESFDHVLYRAEREGKLPFGLFKQVATKRLKTEVDEVHERLQRFAIQPDQIFQIEFCTSCDQPTQVSSDQWLFPAVTISYSDQHQVVITGKLPQVTPKGLLTLSKGTLADAWKMWPAFLLYCHALRLHSQPLEPHLILAHAAQPKVAFFEDPVPYLKQFVTYYGMCLNHFSPLMPEWIPLILEKNAQGLEEKMEQLFSDSFGIYQSPDLRWVLSRYRLPDPHCLIKEWAEQTELLLGDLVRFWYPVKSSKQPDDV